jgi:zinc and cadmium transporter
VTTLTWIIASGLLMTAIAAVGGLTILLTEERLGRILLPLVAFSAGSLIAGAMLHLIPAALARDSDPLPALLWVLAGFAVFFAVEQLLHYHHCERASASCRQPLTYLILIGDGLHNFLGGLAIGGTFLLDVRLGIAAWLAAAAHEIPQELGDFAVLVHGGWSKAGAIAFNMLSASTFLLGGLVAYFAAARLDVAFLVPFAAGNFLYIGAVDLVPEVNKPHDLPTSLLHLGAFLAGILLLLAFRVLLSDH